jgi:hypothetical protein
MNERFQLKYPIRTCLFHLGACGLLLLVTAVGLISREFPFILIAPFTFVLGMYLIVNIVATNIFGRLFLTLDDKELRLHIWTGGLPVEWTNIATIRAYEAGNNKLVGIQPLVAEPFRPTPHFILKTLTGFSYVFAIDRSMISIDDFKTFIARCVEKLGVDKVRVDQVVETLFS